MKPERDPSNDYNVVCTDAENNQVLLKVVTTHEPIIARVENDHLRNKILKSATSETRELAKNQRRIKNSGFAEKKSESDPKKEHTYVNIFTGSKRTPIYENYKVSELETSEENKSSKINKVSKVNKVKKICKDSADTTPEMKTVEKIVQGTDTKVRETGMKAVPEPEKIRSNKPEETKSAIQSTNKSRPEISSASNLINSGGVARLRSSQTSKTPHHQSRRSSTRSQECSGIVPSTERSLKISSGNSNSSGKNSNGSKSTTRDLASLSNPAVKIIKKNDSGSGKKKPMEVVYQTAVYNMKNERLSKPSKGKESKGPRLLNELICGAKTKRASDSKNGKCKKMYFLYCIKI